MKAPDLRKWQITKHYTDPKLRWFNGHFITAKQLQTVIKQ